MVAKTFPVATPSVSRKAHVSLARQVTKSQASMHSKYAVLGLFKTFIDHR